MSDKLTEFVEVLQGSGALPQSVDSLVSLSVSLRRGAALRRGVSADQDLDVGRFGRTCLVGEGELPLR